MKGMIHAEPTPALWPMERPAIDWNFAVRKSLDSRVTFTRASTATYFDGAGLIQSAAVNATRFDHDPATGVSRGLLIEESRTNLFRYSGELTNAAWTPVGVVTAYGTIRGQPSFLNTRTVAGAGFGLTPIQSPAISGATAGRQYTFSAWVRLVSGPTGAVNIIAIEDGGATASASVMAGAFVLTGTPQRITATLTIVQNDRTGFRFFISSTAGGTYEIEYAAMQVEQAATASSYIPTAAAAATRAAELPTVTGAAFAAWYRQAEGTVAVTMLSTATAARAFTLSNGTLAEQIAVGQDVARVRTASADVASFFASSSLNVGYALAWRANDFACARAGVLATDAAGAVPLIDRLSLGVNALGSGHLNGTLARFRYWPRRLPNAELQRLSL
jgi:hypothetical protein